MPRLAHRAPTPTLLIALATAVCALFVSAPILAPHARGDAPGTVSARELARLAVDQDAARADAAIVALRAMGPTGHAALMEVHAASVTRVRDTPTLPSPAADERLRHAIDEVSGQRDGHASGLYFYTELEPALAEARARHVPLLSFRMLGHLDEELSCANSRYFRTLVYSDESVATLLREHFVLHVSMERPAPTITIDMGDGRTLVRTITGNSVHYVIDARGRVVDALPGLYAPPQFVAALTASERIAAQCGSLESGRFTTCLQNAHREALVALEGRWNTLRSTVPELPTWIALNGRSDGRIVGPGAPSAREAMAETMSKMMVEAPVFDSFSRVPTPEPHEGINWPRLVTMDRYTPSESTLALIRLKSGNADVSAIVRELSRNAMADGVRNELVMHRQVHRWLSAPTPNTDFAVMNAQVYRELFLTPASDPWLGLRANDVWDAIESVH